VLAALIRAAARAAEFIEHPETAAKPRASWRSPSGSASMRK